MAKAAGSRAKAAGSRAKAAGSRAKAAATGSRARAKAAGSRAKAAATGSRARAKAAGSRAKAAGSRAKAAPEKGDYDHPSLDIVGSRGAELAGKKAVLCVSGSVAAYKAIELARLLMRHGAEVTCVASAAATRLVRPEYFRWATGRPAVTRLTGAMEHVRLADFGRADVIVAYPATANTLGRLANGIDDTPVSTVLTVGLGAGMPVLVCPAMHASMYGNAAVRRNVEFLRGRAEVVGPRMEEGKAMAAEPEEVLERVLARLGRSPELAGRSVLMTAGPTAEPIDPVRSITSRSTGRTGALLARELVAAGCSVTMVYGPGSEEPPAGARVVRVTTVKEMDGAVRGEMARKKFDILVMAAAAADYTVRRPRKAKIDSGAERMTLELERAPKIIRRAREAQRGALLVGFKAVVGATREGLERGALDGMRRSGADMVVANDVGDPRYAGNPRCNSVIIITRGGRKRRTGWQKKERIAAAVRAEIGREMGRRAGEGGV